MLRFLGYRLLQSLLVLFLVYTGTFWLLMAVPGDPFLGEKNPPAAVREALKQRYGLESRPRAYVLYGLRLLRGDLGPTIQYENITVQERIADALPVSMALGSFALLIALWMGLAAGTWGAIAKGRWPDHILTVGTLAGISLPSFILGSVLLMIFAVYLPLLPSGGWGRVSQLILPATALSLGYLACIARLTRVSVLDVLQADFVRTARAKGLPESRVITHHVLRNSSLPVLSFLGPATAGILTGSFVVEKIFAVPGLGDTFVNACLNVDIPLVLGSVMVYTVVVVFFNFLVDLAYVAVDPRIAIHG